MEKIFTVVVGSFCKVEKTDYGYRYEVDEENIKHINCIQDEEEMVDIETNDRFYLLKRNENGTIAQSEYKIIMFNKNYALHSNIVDFKKYNNKEVLKIYLQAIKTRCLINKTQKQLKKQK